MFQPDGTSMKGRQTTDDESSGTASPPFTLEQFVQRCPFVADEAWAMEEYQRLCPSNPGQWYGTQLPSEVWAPPGTAECPFHTATEKKVPDGSVLTTS